MGARAVLLGLSIRFAKPAFAILLGVAVGHLAGSRGLANADSAADGNDVFQLDAPSAPFVPAQPRTSADRRRLEALALFATARAAQQQDRHEAALRSYQRAFRHDPHAVSIARTTVELAFRLKRPAVAVRYALRVADLDDDDPVLMRRLGLYLTEQGDWEQAIRLYEGAIQSRVAEKMTAGDLLLRLELGKLHYLSKNHDKAAEHFAQVLFAVGHPSEFALDDETTKILLGAPAAAFALFGDCFLLADRPEDALAAYEKAHEADPDPARFEVHRARVWLQSGQPENAVEAVQAAFRHDGVAENAVPYRVFVDALRQLGREDEILPRLEALRTERAECAALRQILAEQYHDAGRLEDAAVLYEQLLNTTPSPAIFRGLAEVYRTNGDSEALLRVLGALAAESGSLESLGPQREDLLADKEGLAGIFQAARGLAQPSGDGPDHGKAVAAALLALESGQFDVAGEFFEAALATRAPQAAELFMTWGAGLLAGGEFDASAAIFHRALESEAQPTNHALFYFHLAAALELSGRTDDALQAAQKAAELRPDSPRFHERLGWILFHAGRYEEAKDAYRRVIERFDAEHRSADTRDVLRQARLILSNLHVLMDENAEAEAWLEEVLDEFPDDPGALNDLGYLWADQGKNLEWALEMIERAVAAQPDNAAFRDSLGWAYHRLGRHEEAVIELEKAAGLDHEPDPIILDHLGDAYAATDQMENARNAWRRAAEAFRKTDRLEKARVVEEKIQFAGNCPE